MPTDHVKNRTFKETLSGCVRFKVPFFQRGYAWEKKQWDQLFVDIQEQIIQELEQGAALDEVEHFFGPIVVMEQMGPPEVKEFLVIDGQQRITTVYLLLAIIRDQIRAKKHLSGDAHAYLEDLKKYIFNDVGGSDDYLKLKVFSSKGDRLPTYRVACGTDTNPRTPWLQTDLQMYVPGKNGVDAFQKYALKKLKGWCSDVPALWQLAQAILTCLKIVWIPLDEQKDDAQAIFESLNDKGMPLTASELLCNFLFRPIIEAKENPEELHNSQWLAAIRLLEDDDRFEDTPASHIYRRDEDGRQTPKGLCSFQGEEPQANVRAGQTGSGGHFRERTSLPNIKDPLSYPHQHEAINQLLIAISNTRMDSSTPFVLSVLRALAAGTVSEDIARAMLRETLILLVRRKMTELATTEYDKMFPSLLGSIINEPHPVKALHDRFRSHGVWISDQEFDEAVKNKRTYRTNDLAFSRMLLIEIDKRFQTHGQFPDYSTVGTIEHVIPQTLDERWKAYLGAEADDDYLPIVVDTIGNLALLSGPANSSAGRDPFESKKLGYSPLTALARQIKEHSSRWDMTTVRDRSKILAAEALKVWSWATV